MNAGVLLGLNLPLSTAAAPIEAMYAQESIHLSFTRKCISSVLVHIHISTTSIGPQEALKNPQMYHEDSHAV